MEETNKPHRPSRRKDKKNEQNKSSRTHNIKVRKDAVFSTRKIKF